MMKSFLSLCIVFGLALSLHAGQEPSATPAAPPKFGPFVALTIDDSYIKGVRVDEEDKIWILLDPSQRNNEIILRLSNDFKASYRNWHTGEKDFISPAGQNKAANEWTDWIRTKAGYIEYWMDGKLVLHLQRVS